MYTTVLVLPYSRPTSTLNCTYKSTITYVKMNQSVLFTHLTFGVHGNPLAGTGVEGRGGVGGRSSSLPLLPSISGPISSSLLPFSPNGSSRLVCFMKPGFRTGWHIHRTTQRAQSLSLCTLRANDDSHLQSRL